MTTIARENNEATLVRLSPATKDTSVVLTKTLVSPKIVTALSDAIKGTAKKLRFRIGVSQPELEGMLIEDSEAGSPAPDPGAREAPPDAKSSATAPTVITPLCPCRVPLLALVWSRHVHAAISTP